MRADAPRADTGPDGRIIRSMFGDIAPRYDLLNHVLSLSIDRRWRKHVARLIASRDPLSTDRCLDLCTGTGDLAIEVERTAGVETYAADFCHPMLVRLQSKTRSSPRIRITESDAQQLPFADSIFRFVTVAFGLRNIESRSLAIAEMSRVLRPGGVLVILEFSRPVVPVIRELFLLYFRYVLPRVGSWISGTRGPYSYLPQSVSRFPSQSQLRDELERAGLVSVQYRNLSFGIAAMHWGVRP